ncbi:DNA repair protein REV1 [Leucoagaricus sp. SymC.cos]|nr:DNA repair protein REV1 [Leucoagaricus sp. SymC.cos]
MENYFPKVAKTSSSCAPKKPRYHPYEPQPSQSLYHEKSLRDTKCILKELNKGLLRSLANEHNPITHSDAGDRADRVVSISTGHQIGEERQNRRLYLQDRERKLSAQRNPSTNSNGILRSVRVYLSGYSDGTTDIEMKRIITEAGGQAVMVPSQCTHIITSQWLSGSKTHRLLTTKTRNNPYIVRPEWIFDSIAKGKRLPERSYAISIDNSHASLNVQVKY